MATETNKKIIEKTKEILKDLGYEVKTGHIYEMYSRMAGFKNWHVAKTKDIDFINQLPSNPSSEPSMTDLLSIIQQTRVKNPIPEKVLKIARKEKSLNMSSYENMLSNNKFKNVFNYGIDLETKQFITSNPLVDPGALFCGGMGSGKTIGMRFTLATHILSNSEDTVYILLDSLKGMTDYEEFFNLDNVYPILNDPSKIIPVIEWIYKEMLARKKEFSKHNCTDLIQYNKTMKSQGQKELPQIVLGIEEFHLFISSNYLNFTVEQSIIGTPASQLKDLMRVGRSFGFMVLAATQSASSQDVPSSMKPGFSKLLSFRNSNILMISALNLPQSLDIPAGYPGLCVSPEGLIQFPYLDEKDIKILLAKYYKPLKGKLLTDGLDKI